MPHVWRMLGATIVRACVAKRTDDVSIVSTTLCTPLHFPEWARARALLSPLLSRVA